MDRYAFGNIGPHEIAESRRCVEDYFGLPHGTIQSGRRGRVSLARHVYLYALREIGKMPVIDAGIAANTHHTIVVYAVHKLNRSSGMRQAICDIGPEMHGILAGLRRDDDGAVNLCSTVGQVLDLADQLSRRVGEIAESVERIESGVDTLLASADSRQRRKRAAASRFDAESAKRNATALPRTCLKCGNQFASRHSGNRRCGKCTADAPHVVPGWEYAG